MWARYTIIAILALGSALVLGTGYHLLTAEQDLPVSAERAELTAAIAQDSQRAYASLKETYRDRSFDEQHNIAHLFGESLYDVHGIAGIATCDGDLNFGCYHGFLTRAISREGVPVVAELDAACHAYTSSGAASACQHGIGHGILEFYGHDRLLDALMACRHTNQPDPLAGCTGGVFMEYNVPLLVGPGNTFTMEPRPYDAVAPYAPCPELPAEFQASCYHELPQWWGQVIGKDMARIGTLCEAAGNETLRIACFHGAAGTIPSTAEYEAAGAIALCEAFPEHRQTRCLIDAAWSFVSNTGNREKARTLCAEVEPAAAAACPS